MSRKSMVLILVFLAAMVGAGYLAFRADRTGAPPSDSPSDLSANDPRAAPSPAPAAPAASRRDDPAPGSAVETALEKTAGAPAPEGSLPPEGGPPMAAEAPPPEAADSSPAEIVALGAEFKRLKQIFAESGWTGLKDEIEALRKLSIGKGGVQALLSIIDGEEDPDFLEAVLHHLVSPNSGKSGRGGLEALVTNEELSGELWERFRNETDDARRASLLAFFGDNPRLLGKKAKDFLDIATTDRSPKVRARVVDALQAFGKRDDTWPVLQEIARSDPDEDCRAAAIHGLARSSAESAQEIVRAAFTSQSEKIRTAALESEAELPKDPGGGNGADYLRGEFQSAGSNALRSAVLDRLIAVSPESAAAELRDALMGERLDERARKYFRAALELLEGGVQESEEIHRQTRQLYSRFRYGG